MEKWFSWVTLDIIGSSSFGNEFCGLESASIRGSSSTEEKSGSELADEHNTIFGVGGPFRIVAMLSMIFPFSLVQSLTLRGTHDVVHPVSTIGFVTVQIIHAKKICPSYPPAKSQSKDILPLRVKSNTYTGDGESGMRD